MGHTAQAIMLSLSVPNDSYTAHFDESRGDAILEGSGKQCSLEAPFINHNKADIVKEVLRLGVFQRKITMS